MKASSNTAGPRAPCGPAVCMQDLNKSFHTGKGGDRAVPALRGISLSIPEEQFVTMLGPSGCGKTTLLRLVDGLLRPDSGQVQVFGKPPRPGPDIGFVFQSFRLIPWETVWSNVEFGLHSLGLSRSERAERVDNCLALVGLSKFATAYPRELSGGMRQRVALARAFAGQPRLLLMDEPFASIDAQTRELMQIELMRLWSQRKATVLFVTHSVDEAIFLSDRIVLMGPRPGRIIEELEVDLPRPRWTYDVHSDPRYTELRGYLARRMYDLVINDPDSEFYGRDIAG